MAKSVLSGANGEITGRLLSCLWLLVPLHARVALKRDFSAEPFRSGGGYSVRPSLVVEGWTDSAVSFKRIPHRLVLVISGLGGQEPGILMAKTSGWWGGQLPHPENPAYTLHVSIFVCPAMERPTIQSLLCSRFTVTLP